MKKILFMFVATISLLFSLERKEIQGLTISQLNDIKNNQELTLKEEKMVDAQIKKLSKENMKKEQKKYQKTIKGIKSKSGDYFKNNNSGKAPSFNWEDRMNQN